MTNASIPATMLAIDPQKPGGPEALQPRLVPVPRPAAGEVLIHVHAAGVNRADILQRLGHYPPPAGIPTTLGLEAAGVVVASGDPAGRWQPGARVTALAAGGAYAEYLCVPAGQCLPVPQGLSMAEAATLPETWFTVWANLEGIAHAQPGETILVHGGTSGIGSTAIDHAKLRGLAIIVTCGSDAKCAAARDMGATLAINYRREDFVARVEEHTKGRGVDIILDMVGGDYVARNLTCLADKGRHLSIAALGGGKAELPIGLMMRRRLMVTGSTLRPRSVEMKANIAKALEAEVWPAFADGRLRPHLCASFAFAEAAKAHSLMEAGGHIGKIAIVMPAGGGHQ